MTRKSIPKGLGFLEVIIALSVMIIGVTSGLTLTTFNLANVIVAENQVLATGLAREPIEIIRERRDTNWLSSKSWNNGLEHNGNYVIMQYFDTTTNSWDLKWTSDTDFNNCERCNVIYDDVRKMYLQNIDSSGQPLVSRTLTGYLRWTKVNDICWDTTQDKQYIADYGATCGTDTTVGWRLTTEVSWYDNQNKKSLKVSEDLYDWR